MKSKSIFSMEIRKTETDLKLIVSQTAFAMTLLWRFRMENAKNVNTLVIRNNDINIMK